MDTNDIFKLPSLPKGATKRKMQAPAPPTFGAISLNMAAAPQGTLAGDEQDENERDFAPGGDADHFIEEDDDGRFFGGGLNPLQKQVLNLMDSAADVEAGEVTSTSLRKQILTLEKNINKNRDMRTKFGTDPGKFVDSEYALLESLHALLPLASTPLLAYPILLELSTAGSLADLLSHENTDVVIAVIEVLEELTDEEVLDADVDEDEEEEEMGARDREDRQEVMRGLVGSMVDAGVVESVVAGLDRLNEDDEAERGGVYHTLSFLENLLSLAPELAAVLLSPKSALLAFLIKRLGQDKGSAERVQNRYYAAELLAILLGGGVEAAQAGRERLAREGGIDELLRVLSHYRKRDPASADELEFLENLFDSLCSALSSPVVKDAFAAEEGIELCLIMMKERKTSWTRAVKVLDHALSGRSGIKLCEHFVAVLGLGTLFKAFMGNDAATVNGKKTKLSPTTYEDTEHLLSLTASLFSSLVSDSAPRLRLLAKFVEADYEKVDRLLEMRQDVEARVQSINPDEDVQVDEDEDEAYLKKLDKGLFSLQLADYIIAWLCMEDDGVRDHIKMLLARRDRSIADVMKVLIEYHANIGDAALDETIAGAEGETEMTEEEEQRHILDNLLTYLHGMDD